MSSPFSRLPPPPDFLYFRFIRDHTERLKAERPDSGDYPHRHNEAHQRWLQLDVYPRSAYQQLADDDHREHQRRIDDFERRKTLPSCSQSLSSLSRPPLPTATPQQLRQRRVSCLILPSPLLRELLSFVADAEFFFVFPRLSAFHRWAFSDPALHRLHGQRRFGFNNGQWRLWSEASFPQLIMPVQQCAFYGYAQLPLGLERFDERKDRAAPASLSDEKDWAVESLHLQQHLTFATRYITRIAPTTQPRAPLCTIACPASSALCSSTS